MNFPACKQWKAAMYDGKSPGYSHINPCSDFSSATCSFVILLLSYLTSPNQCSFLCKVEQINPILQGLKMKRDYVFNVKQSVRQIDVE